VAGGASGGGLLSMAVPFANGSVVDESLPLVPFVQMEITAPRINF